MTELQSGKIQWRGREIAGFWWLGVIVNGRFLPLMCKGRVGSCIRW